MKPCVEHGRADVLVINVPSWYSDPEFVAWLESNSNPVMTWHRPGRSPSEFSDAIVLVDPSLTGEGTDQGSMPERYWEQIVSACREHCAVPPMSEACHHIVVRLTNLAA